MYGYSAYVHPLCVCSDIEAYYGQKKGWDSQWDSSYRWFWTTILVLGIESRSTGRPARTLTHWDISPVPIFSLFIHALSFGAKVLQIWNFIFIWKEYNLSPVCRKWFIYRGAIFDHWVTFIQRLRFGLQNFHFKNLTILNIKSNLEFPTRNKQSSTQQVGSYSLLPQN